MLKRLIVEIAYALNTSKSYQAKKSFIYNLLENNKYKYKKYVDIFMISLIFVSVGVLIREVKHPIHDYMFYFNSYVISFIFFIEYLLRFWIHSSVSEIIVNRAEHDSMLSREVNLSKAFKEIYRVKASYIFSITAIIDILAIMPFFHELRLLRLFILFRVFKLFRYANSFQTLAGVLASKKFEFFTLGIFASVVIFVSSILIYVMEANNPNSPIDTLFEAVYWSIVTISTVGYGDITPTTYEGRVVAIVVITAGIAVLAFTTSLVVSAFTEKLDEIKEIKTVGDITKLKSFYLLCGYENVAQDVAKKLRKSQSEVIVLDEDFDRIEQAKKDGFRALNYDPGKLDSYKKLHINFDKQIKAVLCLREDDVENVYTALTVRSMSKDVFMLSLLMENSNRKKLEFTGINKLVYPQELIGLITKELIGQPVAFEIIHELRSEKSNVQITEVAVTQRIVENFSFVGELGNKDYRVVLLGVYKKESEKFYFNPIDSTVISNGDFLLVIGYSVFIKEFEQHLHTKVEHDEK
jgi:voltage-gated potassium channel